MTPFNPAGAIKIAAVFEREGNWGTPRVPRRGSVTPPDDSQKKRGPSPPRPEPVIVTKSYDLARWLLERTARFPRAYRFGLGEAIQREVLSMQSSLLTASFTRDRTAALRAASLAHTRLRVLIRLARDVQCLSTKQYLFVIEPMEEVGRMLGGWSRSEEQPPRTST